MKNNGCVSIQELIEKMFSKTLILSAVSTFIQYFQLRIIRLCLFLKISTTAPHSSQFKLTSIRNFMHVNKLDNSSLQYSNLIKRLGSRKKYLQMTNYFNVYLSETLH